MREILEAASDHHLLATVVRTEGSTYRRPGTHLLVRPGDGNDLERRAAEVLRSGRPTVVSYPGGDETLWELGLGCRGSMDLLLETMETGRAWVDFARDRLARKRPGLVLTQLDTAGRIFWSPRGWSAHGHVGDELRRELLASATELLAAGRHEVWDNALLEVVEPPWPLLLCGAGPEVLPLARLARELGWDVQVTDPRPAYGARFRAARVLVGEPGEVLGRLQITERTAAVVMARHPEYDREYLRALLASYAGYIGVLGPRRRTDRFLGELGAEPEGRLHAPVGLDLGAEGPDEIALSILSEIVGWRRLGQKLVGKALQRV